MVASRGVALLLLFGPSGAESLPLAGALGADVELNLGRDRESERLGDLTPGSLGQQQQQQLADNKGT